MRWMPIAVGLAGAWTIANGVAHDIGVWNAARSGGWAYDLRYASLMGLGVTLAFAGALQVWGAFAMRRGERWGRVLAIAAGAFVAVQIVILIPILPAIGLLVVQAGAVLLSVFAGRQGDAKDREEGATRAKTR